MIMEVDNSQVERFDRLEQEVRRLSAERQILETMNAYTYCFDYGDCEAFVDCFTEQGSFKLKFPGVTEVQAHVGRANLAEFIRRQPHAPDVFRKHLMLAPRFTFDSGGARVRSYWILIDGDAATGPSVNSFGNYDDRLVECDDGKWRISERLAEVERFVAA
jgi:hypothetical protein